MKSTYTIAIAIPRFQKRFSHIRNELESKIRDQYEIMGVDSVDLDFSNNPALEIARMHMSEGQAACALSHIKAYNRILELNLKHALIIEDDANIPADMEQIIESCLPYLSSRGVISFYSPRPTPSKYSSRNAPKLTSGQLLAPTSGPDVHTATAYLIEREAAIKIIAAQSPLRHLADHWSAFRKKNAIDRILLPYPMPISVAHFDSSIGYDTGMRKFLKSVIVALPVVRSVLQRKRQFREKQQKQNIVVVDEVNLYEKKRANNEKC